MSQAEGCEQDARQVANRKGTWRRRVLFLAIFGLIALVTLAGVMYGRRVSGWMARRLALRQLEVGAVTAAQQWLAWSAWLDPADGETDLIQATCLRHLQELDGYTEALQSALKKGGCEAGVALETELGHIQAGKMADGSNTRLGELMEAGLPAREVASAYIFGFLARGNPQEALKVLDAWATDSPQEPQRLYMKGVYWQWLGDTEKAEKAFRDAFNRQPRHELAQMALAGLLEEQERLEDSLQCYRALAARFPASDRANVGLARLLRRLGSISRARAVLEIRTTRAQLPPGAALEMAQVEFESGNYDRAADWFRLAEFSPTEDFEIMTAAATDLALDNEVIRADKLFGWIDTCYWRAGRIEDLKDRLTVVPQDQQASAELRYLAQPVPATPVSTLLAGPEPVAKRSPGSRAPSGAELYARHCSACHGADGDGSGRAARHLFPKPRDFRNESFRLVSTPNAVPTLGDVEWVIRRGMPGTSMRAFDNLSENEQTLLAKEVLRLNREGIRERYVRELLGEGEEIDDDEVREVVTFCTTPEEPVLVPSIGPLEPRAIADGKELYRKLGCNKCHGDDGHGRWDTRLFDERGRLSPPRDLVRAPFKGGHDPRSIYLRIRLGMPGSPHPSCGDLLESEVIDLVQYCRSLSQEPKRHLTNHESAQRIATWPLPLAVIQGD